MPEGHTIHRLAREHNRLFRGHVLQASSPQGRFAAGAARLDGRVLVRAEAIGKHLFHRYDGGRWLHVHLGLYGKFSSGPVPAPAARGALRLRLVGDGHWADLRGPTACEVVAAGDVAAVRDRLGPDPLRRAADPERAWARLSRSRVPIGALLMDQAVVAGIGNVYRAEILFRHRIAPHLPGRSVSRATWEALWPDLVELMRAGVRTGRIVTTHPADRPVGARRTAEPLRGPRARSAPRPHAALDAHSLSDPDPTSAHYVYRRAGLPCRRCGTAVRTEALVGRNLYWCPTCQR